MQGWVTDLEEGCTELDGAWRVVLTLKAPRVPPHVAAHIKVEVPALLRRQAHLLPAQAGLRAALKLD